MDCRYDAPIVSHVRRPDVFERSAGNLSRLGRVTAVAGRCLTKPQRERQKQRIHDEQAIDDRHGR